MTRSFVLLSLLLAVAIVSSGCSTPQAKLTYTLLPQEGADGTGYPFVVPRTVVKVTPTFDKDSGSLTGVAFASIPVSTTADGKPLIAFLATDSSTSGWSLTPTTINAVTYVDDLIVTAIGTQVTDNRSDAVSTLVTTMSLAGAFAAGTCGAKSTFQPFVISDFSADAEVPHQGNQPSCFKYTIKAGPAGGATAMKSEGIDSLPRQSVAWFPIPACKSYTISVARCGADCTTQQDPVYSSTVSVSDGTSFRKVPLPAKGKVTMHTDFCGADVTNDGAGGTNWGVLKELISDVKSAKK